jgi:hypothetical protein
MQTAKVEKRISDLENKVDFLMDHLERAETSAGIQRGLREMEKGLGTPARAVVARLRKKFKLSSK